MVVAALLALVGACGQGTIGQARELPVEELAPQTQGLLGGTVEQHVTASCSTAAVLGLSKQIADEVGCIDPNALVPFGEGGGIVFTGSAVLPYLAKNAKQDLLAAVAARGGTLEVNSAYRTVAQQYLLYRWGALGRCGISVVATPGTSNHESGRALDVNNYDEWISALGNKGWSHDVPGDPVHFDHLGSPDSRGLDVKAFQRLWNRNHPNDQIAEDGLFGPATEARLKQSPADGFAKGADCSAGTASWNAAREGAAPAERTVKPGVLVAVTITLKNTGTTTWAPGEVFLGTTSPRDRDSVFFGPTWVSPSRAATVLAKTAPGQVGSFTFTMVAPNVPQTRSFTESFGLVREGVTWFGPEDIAVAITVAPGGGPADDPNDPDQPNDPNDPNGDPDGNMVEGGCTVSAVGASRGGAGPAWLGLVLAALAGISCERGARGRGAAAGARARSRG
jgi:hypothetical protein